jgi:SAM-dependent methyltransferase
MSTGPRVPLVERSRATAFGQSWNPTLVDRLGVWLSARQLLRHAGPLEGKSLGDFGCGYHATFARSVLDRVRRAVLVDVALANDLKAHPKVTAIEGAIPGSLAELPSESLDVVVCVSVLEHLWEPVTALTELRRLMRANGVCLLNVPSWRGKWFLEFSAFRLGTSPPAEMDDHKMYYDPRDLWPLLVRAGFQPHAVRVFRHKLGLNTFAVCRAT